MIRYYATDTRNEDNLSVAAELQRVGPYHVKKSARTDGRPVTVMLQLSGWSVVIFDHARKNI